MKVKIEGRGKGRYGNRGSCVGVRKYVEDEDLERMKKGEEVEGLLKELGE